jgi:tetratricopeptide (TPR) repeat protein
MYIRLLLYVLFVVSHFCHDKIQASQIQIFEDKCPCFANGDNEPIREIGRLWNKIQTDIFLSRGLTKTPSNDIPLKLRSEYDMHWNPISKSFQEARIASFKDPQTYGHYYPSDCKMLFENLHRYADLYKEWEVFDRKFVHEHKLCTSIRWDFRHVWANQYDDDIREIYNDVHKKRREWNISETEIFKLFQQVQKICLERHISLRSFYECGYLNLLQGDVEKALAIIQKLIDYSQETNNTKYLQADTFLHMGVACTLSHEYEKAVHALSEGIKKHPKKKDLFVERAIAYFELGDFDKALEDYIASGKDQHIKPPKSGSKLKFAKGFLKGAVSGTLAGAKEMPASLWYSAKGACNLLWATASHPIDTSEKVVDAVYDTINYLKNEDLSMIGKKLVPEMYELLKDGIPGVQALRVKKQGLYLESMVSTLSLPTEA